MSEPLPLNELRDQLLATLRGLVRRFGEVYPRGLEFRGILERGEQVLKTQEPRLEEAGALDLEADPDDPFAQEEAFRTLLQLQHLPQMILAMGQVLVQEKEDPSLAPLAEEAKAAAGRLELLIHLWLIAQQRGGAGEGGSELV